MTQLKAEGAVEAQPARRKFLGAALTGAGAVALAACGKKEEAAAPAAPAAAPAAEASAAPAADASAPAADASAAK